MKFVEAKVLIKAPPGKVWAILMDFKSYGEWNPFVRSLEGACVPGASLLLSLSMNLRPGKVRRREEVLLALEPGRALCWGRVIGSPSFFEAHRWQVLYPREEGKACEYHTYESFSGWFSFFWGMMYGKRLQAGFEAAARELEKRALELESPG